LIKFYLGYSVWVWRGWFRSNDDGGKEFKFWKKIIFCNTKNFSIRINDL